MAAAPGSAGRGLAVRRRAVGLTEERKKQLGLTADHDKMLALSVDQVENLNKAAVQLWADAVLRLSGLDDKDGDIASVLTILKAKAVTGSSLLQMGKDVRNFTNAGIADGPAHSLAARIKLLKTLANPGAVEAVLLKVKAGLAQDIKQAVLAGMAQHSQQAAVENARVAEEMNKVVIDENTPMPAKMQQEAVKWAKEALAKYKSHTDVAVCIKNAFDTNYKYTTRWQCIVGNFTYYINKDGDCYMHFYVGKVEFLIFRAA